MQAHRASRSGVLTPRIQGTAVLVINQAVQQMMEFGLEQSLQPPQYEVAPC